MTKKPAKKRPTGWKKKKLKHPSQIKVSRSIAMRLEEWDRLDERRGRIARGTIIAKEMNLTD